jgi:hypothetical protein
VGEVRVGRCARIGSLNFGENKLKNPNNYTSLDDSEFDQVITLRQSYLIMFKFLKDVYDIEDFVVGSVLGDLQLLDDNISLDPAILSDFLKASQNVVNDPSIIESLKFNKSKGNES